MRDQSVRILSDLSSASQTQEPFSAACRSVCCRAYRIGIMDVLYIGFTGAQEYRTACGSYLIQLYRVSAVFFHMCKSTRV